MIYIIANVAVLGHGHHLTPVRADLTSFGGYAADFARAGYNLSKVRSQHREAPQHLVNTKEAATTRPRNRRGGREGTRTIDFTAVNPQRWRTGVYAILLELESLNKGGF
jgi:hypothetical protein